MRKLKLWLSFLMTMATCRDSEPMNDGAANDAANDAVCPVSYYTQPGCGPESQPRCFENAGGASGGTYCDCDGKIQFGYGTGWSQRFAYRLPGWPPDAATCDPNVDAGAK